MNSNATGSGDRVDVCLLLEGTYPYVQGGVSTWVHQIVSAMPELRFEIAYIGAEKEATGAACYDLPTHVTAIHHTFLFDADATSGATGNARANRKLRATAFELFVDSDPDSLTQDSARSALQALASAAEAAPSGFDAFWEHPDTWLLLREVYQRRLATESFIEVYWSLRYMLRPLWRLCTALPQLPAAAVYHSVSTGYAGVLGALAAERHDGTFLLSEHGIYVRERIAELLRADWLPQTASQNPNSPGFSLAAIPAQFISPLRQLWIEQFIELGQFGYHTAARIVSLFQKNADHQVEFGAPADRIDVIPNGVNVNVFDALHEQRQAARRSQPDRMQVGFLGRVVTIKDVKSLLRAASIVLAKLPEARFLIMGPVDEDPDYAHECDELTRQLHISGAVEFSGAKTLDEALPEIDIMVLSSVSEGLPFVALEAFAAGIPLIATDVGACRELVEGRHNESPALGPAGAVVPVADPSELASAIIRLLSDRELQDRLGNAGRQRVTRDYAESDVIAAYRHLYQRLPQPELVSDN